MKNQPDPAIPSQISKDNSIYYEACENSFERDLQLKPRDINENNQFTSTIIHQHKTTNNFTTKPQQNQQNTNAMNQCSGSYITFMNKTQITSNNNTNTNIINVNVNINQTSNKHGPPTTYGLIPKKIVNYPNSIDYDKHSNISSHYEDWCEIKDNENEKEKQIPCELEINDYLSNPWYSGNGSGNPNNMNTPSNNNNSNENSNINKSLITPISSGSSYPSNREYKISTVQFDQISEQDINLYFLSSKLRIIPIKTKSTNNINKHFKNWIELQNFYSEKSPIWITSFSNDGKYLATGSKEGLIKIFEIMNYEYSDYKTRYKKEEIFSYLNFLNEKPKLVWNEHSGDIIDLSWSPHNHSYLLSASIDHFAMLWDVSNPMNPLISRYPHGDMITSICYSPTDDNIFMTGCLDRFARFWTINKTSKPDYFNIKEKITAVAFFPNGETVAIGTHNGRVIIYDIFPKMSYNCSFSCRNKIGKNALGKKVTNIEFINKNSALITTADSRLRLVSMPDGKLLYKYKGFVGEEGMIRAHCNTAYDCIICGSEDGSCYVWNKDNKEGKSKKNYAYESFRPFSKESVECSDFAHETCSSGYLKKIYKLTTKIFILSIIINATNKGRIQVLLNIEETY